MGRTVCETRETFYVRVGEQALYEPAVLLVVQPRRRFLSFPVGQTDVEGGE